MTGAEASIATPAGVRDGDPAALAALTMERGPAVLAYAHAVLPPDLALQAAAEAFARFRAALLALGDLPDGIDPAALLLGAVRRSVAALTAPAPGGRLTARRACAQVPVLVAARLEGELAPADAEKLRRHLARDRACREIEQRFLAAERAFAEPPPHVPSAGVTAAIVGALAAAGEAGHGPVAAPAGTPGDAAGPSDREAGPPQGATPEPAPPGDAPARAVAAAPTAAAEAVAPLPAAPADTVAAAHTAAAEAATPRPAAPADEVAAAHATAAEAATRPPAGTAAPAASAGPGAVAAEGSPDTGPPAFARPRRHGPVAGDHGLVRTVVAPLAVVGAGAVLAMAIAGVFGEDQPVAVPTQPPITAPAEPIPQGPRERPAPAPDPPDVVRGNGQGEDVLGDAGVPAPGTAAGPAGGDAEREDPLGAPATTASGATG